MTAPADEPRDLAGEHTEREAYRARLRADISVEEANEEAEYLDDECYFSEMGEQARIKARRRAGT